MFAQAHVSWTRKQTHNKTLSSPNFGSCQSTTPKRSRRLSLFTLVRMLQGRGEWSRGAGGPVFSAHPPGEESPEPPQQALRERSSLGVTWEGNEVREALCKSKQVIMKLSRWRNKECRETGFGFTVWSQEYTHDLRWRETGETRSQIPQITRCLLKPTAETLPHPTLYRVYWK